MAVNRLGALGDLIQTPGLALDLPDGLFQPLDIHFRAVADSRVLSADGLGDRQRSDQVGIRGGILGVPHHHHVAAVPGHRFGDLERDGAAVDEVLTSGLGSYDYPARDKPVLDLVRELTSRKGFASISIRKGDFSLTLC